jgi:hypothetical protein
MATSARAPRMTCRTRRDDVHTGGESCTWAASGGRPAGRPRRRPACRRRDRGPGVCAARGHRSPRWPGRHARGGPPRVSVPRRGPGAASPVVVRKARSRRGSAGATACRVMARSTSQGRNLVDQATPVDSSTRHVGEASTPVKATQGAAGGEGPSMAACAEAVAHTLDTRWTRLASGRDGPRPGRRGDIPTGAGRGTRP